MPNSLVVLVAMAQRYLLPAGYLDSFLGKVVGHTAHEVSVDLIKISGWQEIALRHSDEYNEAVRPQVYSVNCWSTLPSQGQGGVVQAIAESGYPVILSNVNHYYFERAASCRRRCGVRAAS